MCLEFSVKISAQFNGQQTGNQRMKEDCSSCLVWFFSHGLSFSLAKPFSTAVPFGIYIRGS